VQGVDGLGTMWTDVTKLRQILLNVLSNATKFTQAGTVKLVAYVEPSSGGDRIVFRISDTGLGMTPEQKARIFEAFVQADAGHTRRFGGTGLGLAISKRFCHMMGGEIDVESAPGKGSTFTLRIPRRAPEKSIASRPPGSSGGNASLPRVAALP
jgi:signal transduction histidine kinase